MPHHVVIIIVAAAETTAAANKIRLESYTPTIEKGTGMSQAKRKLECTTTAERDYETKKMCVKRCAVTNKQVVYIFNT